MGEGREEVWGGRKHWETRGGEYTREKLRVERQGREREWVDGRRGIQTRERRDNEMVKEKLVWELRVKEYVKDLLCEEEKGREDVKEGKW